MVLLNTFFSINKPVAIFHWLKVFEFAVFGFYIIKTKPKLSIIKYAFAVGILYSSTIAIAQFFLQHSIGGPLWFLGERTFSSQTPGIAQIQLCLPECRLLLRPYATFPHPNVLGGFLAVTLPFLMRPMSQMRQISKKFYQFVFLLGLIALFLTFSRSAWLVGLLGIAWVYIPTRLKKPYVIFSILVFLMGIFLVRDFAGTSESVIVREQLNNAAISMWRQSPILGVGLGNFLVNLPKVLPSRTVYFLQPVHNIYLLILSETGVIGLGIFLFLILYIFKNFQLPISNFPFPFFSLLLLGLVDHYPATLQQGQLLLIIFLSLSLLKKKFD